MSSMLDWFSEAGNNLTQGAEDLADSVGDIAKSVWSNVSEGVSAAYEGGKVPEFISGLVSGGNYDGYTTGSSNNLGDVPGNVGGYSQAADSKSWSDMFKGFVSNEKNQSKLIELGFGAMAGMAKDSAAKDAAKYKAEADMAILNQKDKLEQEANQRFSQSVGSLKPVQPYKPKPLTRMDGSRVFTPTGLINTGAK